VQRTTAEQCTSCLPGPSSRATLSHTDHLSRIHSGPISMGSKCKDITLEHITITRAVLQRYMLYRRFIDNMLQASGGRRTSSAPMSAR